MSKYLMGQRVRVLEGAYNVSRDKVGMHGYIDRVDPDDVMNLVYRLRLDGRPSECEWVREQDIEPEAGVVVQSQGKTLTQVKAEVAALDAQEAAANTTLASIAEHREKLRVELAGFGLAPLSSVPVEAPKLQTMRELYDNEQIKKGDVFTWNAPDNEDREWTQGRSYIVQRVDGDESVLITDNTGDNWAWKNEGAFDKFVKVA